MLFEKMDKETLGKELTVLRVKLTEANKQISKIFDKGDYWDFLTRIAIRLKNADIEIVEQAKLYGMDIKPPVDGSVLGHFCPKRREE